MISPLANIHPGAQIGKGVKIDAFATVEEKVVIGDGCHIMTHAVILNHSVIGKECTIFPHATVGAIPQDLKYEGEETTVEIGDHTTIRECVTINRGTKEKWKTTVGKNCLLMAYSHIAHDCVIGNHVIIANAVQLAGHVEIGDHASIGGLAAAIQFSKIGAHSYIAGGSEIIKDIPPFVKAGRSPLCYVGINSVGLHRRGFSNEQINKILEIYRVIYLRGYNISQALEHIQDNFPESAEKTEIINFISSSKKGILKLASKDAFEEVQDNNKVQ
ncbi:MAG: acyl-ACP--UDP-N-acetylglucosamine O-acyltransferase [Chitinophagaceae bacterium]|nr:acyl-ACP--UDP-N-acetylglucosamine O-acyltransferase [Chitinophagaceae bacterium]MCW5914952.1 acyl-ACP--UDP-N-acetylglucosamine O-acyltransferase [Chitinophagaceae bacterium]